MYSSSGDLKGTDLLETWDTLSWGGGGGRGEEEEQEEEKSRFPAFQSMNQKLQVNSPQISASSTKVQAGLIAYHASHAIQAQVDQSRTKHSK